MKMSYANDFIKKVLTNRKSSKAFGNHLKKKWMFYMV